LVPNHCFESSPDRLNNVFSFLSGSHGAFKSHVAGMGIHHGGVSAV
jgi:hypothetical protein